MLLTAAVALSLFNPLSVFHHHPKAPHEPAAASRRAQAGAWTVTARWDRFAGATSCVIRARGVRLERQTAIFRVREHGDTTASLFRLDNGPARPVSEAFGPVEAHGVFPQKGWVMDPAGGEIALPAAWLGSAATVTVRVSPRSHPVRFKVAGLDTALAAAKAKGCPEV
jgi:hypothetical protein